MKVWVTRDGEFPDRDLLFWSEEPHCQKPKGSWWVGRVLPIASMTILSFKALFGFTPRKGSCKQMELSLTEIV
jgi:hypothetical protein